MSRKSSQKRIEANRRNAQKSTGPRTLEGKARSSQNATTHGLSSLKGTPLNLGCLLQIEDQAQFQGVLDEYLITYQPQERDELDLLTEAVFAKWRQQRLWLAETAQLEVAIAQNERDLQIALPTATAAAHLANGFAKSEQLLKLYLRYDAQLHRHYRNCLRELRELQALRLPDPHAPIEPKPPAPEPEIQSPAEPAAAPAPTENLTEPNEPKLTPEQARLQFMKAEIQRFAEHQSALRTPRQPQTAGPSLEINKPAASETKS